MSTQPLRAYLSLTKPGITFFIVMVSMAGFFTVSPYPLNLRNLIWLVVSGALGSAGSASLNHYCDRDIDPLMRRTRTRPLPMDVVSPRSALAFGIVLLALSLAIAFVELNQYVVLAIGSGAAVYVGLYTLLLKRRTRLGTVIGGYAGSAAVLGGGAAVAASFPLPVIALALIVFLWTPPHFWSLAIALSSEYDDLNIPALPNPGDIGRSARTVVGSASLLLLPTLAFAFLRVGYLIFFPIAMGAGILFVIMTMRTLRDTSRGTAMGAFIASGIYLAVVSAAMILNWFIVVGPVLHMA